MSETENMDFSVARDLDALLVVALRRAGGRGIVAEHEMEFNGKLLRHRITLVASPETPNEDAA